MDFLNQFPNTAMAKDDNSLFSFTDKAEQKDLPFAFGTQSSEAGEISFLNQMKSQDPGESFALDNSQKNMGGLNFLKTIYEVPESSNNIFNSEGDAFPLQNPMSVNIGMDFIREGSEDNFNFDSFQNNNKQNGENDAINVDINNLFKNSASPPCEGVVEVNSKKEGGGMGKINVSIESSGKKENGNKNMNININKIPSFPKNNPSNQINQNKNISITPEIKSNSSINSRQARSTNNNQVILLNKNNNMNNINNNIIPDNNNNIIPPQFQNITIKPQPMKEQKNNLDDIDKMISMNLQTKSENKQNKNINKSNTNNLPNEISDIFSASTIVGKRANIEPKDKDLQNIDNLLNFTKEPMPSYSSLMNNNNNPKPIMSNSSLNTNNSQYVKKKNNSNTIMIKPLPSDSFDKKSQVIKLTKSEVENCEKKNEKNDAPTKVEIIQRYNDLAVRLNKIREQAKEYRNLGNYFSQLISANENYEYVFPNVIKNLLEEYAKMSHVLLSFMKIKNNKMNEMNNEFDEEVKKYSLAFPEHT